MGIFSNIFNKKEKENVGGMEDFMTLIRVYLQSVMASNMGISNLAAFPDMATFKRSLHVQTVNNKLGIGEKKACGKMLKDIYGISDDFLKEKQYDLKEEVSVKSDYYLNTNKEYEVRCQIVENGSSLIDLKLTVPTETEAEAIANRWDLNSQQIYAMLLANLL